MALFEKYCNSPTEGAARADQGALRLRKRTKEQVLTGWQA